MRLPKLVLAAFFAWIALGISTPANAAECLHGMVPVLIKGDFSGSVDCRRDWLSIRKIGQIQNGRRAFTIYDYHYALAGIGPACGLNRQCRGHGGQRIIFVERGRYVGQYKPYSARLAIRKGKLILTPAEKQDIHFGPVTIKFTRQGPPKEFWFSGEVLSFFR